MLEIILVVLALIAIAGACIYFYTDMKDHKSSNNTDFEKVNKNIEEEETTRLGNIKYVVDQVNTTNTAMDTEYNNRFKFLEDTTTGFGKLILAENASGSNVAFKDDTTVSKLKLMRDVSVIGSMSIKDLRGTSTGNKFKACGIDTSAQCIQFPDDNGNTYLTGITGSNSSVVSGSTFKAEQGLKTNTINNLLDTADLTINTNGNTIIVGKAKADGITLTSGTSTIKIIDGAININTGATDASLTNITLNNKAMGVVSVPEAGTLAAGTKVLTLTSAA